MHVQYSHLLWSGTQRVLLQLEFFLIINLHLSVATEDASIHHYYLMGNIESLKQRAKPKSQQINNIKKMIMTLAGITHKYYI